MFLLCFGRIFLTFSFAGLRDPLMPFLFAVGHFLINLSIFLWDLVLFGTLCYLLSFPFNLVSRLLSVFYPFPHFSLDGFHGCWTGLFWDFCIWRVCRGCENETLVSRFLSLVVLLWFGNILVILG